MFIDEQMDIDINMSNMREEDTTRDITDCEEEESETVEMDVDPLEAQSEPDLLCDEADTEKGNPELQVDSVTSTINRHNCKYCNFSSKHKIHLQTHLESVHSKSRKYKCRFCDFRDKTEEKLEDHMDYVHYDIWKYACRLCNFASSHRESYDEHLSVVHFDLKKFKCRSCDYATGHERSLRMHVKHFHLKIGKYKCNLCGYALSRKRNLKEHVRLSHNDRERQRKICHYVISKKSDADDILYTVYVSRKNYKCEVCDYTTRRRLSLEEHVKSAHLNEV